MEVVDLGGFSSGPIIGSSVAATIGATMASEVATVVGGATTIVAEVAIVVGGAATGVETGTDVVAPFNF
ncbi:UNVERIFIED_CONTAM: hypothetical protein Sradi_6210800 [Sesamum radiatum]|uniref:Uncharacterized protein n=1 Tax=Sesamum radiatum TaxID=300843 RepID=A0AAW2KB51_SESRA